MPMRVLITGASGFIGQALASALLEAEPDVHLTLTDIIKLHHFDQQYMARVKLVQADLCSAEDLQSLLQPTFSACYLLHGIMSGGAEANLDAGLRINFDATRAVLDFLRTHQTGVKIIFPSSLAVYGPSPGAQVVSESTVPLPQNSYGAQKLMIETLINDYSRRGLIDGRVLRLPTVIVRPGAPSAAASSFASGIVRESLRGERNYLPVSPNLEMWICSPQTVVKNLIFAKNIPKEKFSISRTINIPGKTVTVAEILDALEAVGGSEKRALVEEKRDPKVENIVANWPARFNTEMAAMLGFLEDVSLSETVQAFAEQLRPGVSNTSR